MSSKCVDKEGAWGSCASSLPRNTRLSAGTDFTAAVFNAKLEEAMKQEYYIDENGEKKPVSRGVGAGMT